MGRPVFHRQRVRSQAASIEAKSLFHWLAEEIRRRRELAPEEALLVARDALQFLEGHLVRRGPGQIELPAIAGREHHKKAARAAQPERLVHLTVFADEDAALLAEFGMTVMQTSRLVRVIEEAWYQDALLDSTRLCLLFPLSISALRDRLRPLWEQGIVAPLAGMPRRRREQLHTLRGARAVERYLQGGDLTAIRRDLAVSPALWQRWWRAFRQAVAAGPAPAAEVAARTGQPVALVTGWQAVWAALRRTAVAQERLATVPAWEAAATAEPTPQGSFYQVLLQRHHYTPAAAEQFAFELAGVADRLRQPGRGSGQVITFGVASDEPPGRSLSDSRMQLLVLDYVLPEDWQQVEVERPQGLKWTRLQRLATQAYSQGVALSLSDLSFLLGISTDAVRNCMAEHPTVILPTRGRVADMGPTLSHAEKIIALYMDGYTETEVKQRTGHSYESIERYLLDFARVTILVETGMSVPQIRMATGRSRRVVEKYVALYHKFSHPDYAFRMARIRHMAHAHPLPTKKKPRGKEK